MKQNGKNSFHFFSDKIQEENSRAGKIVDLNYLRDFMTRADSGNGRRQGIRAAGAAGMAAAAHRRRAVRQLSGKVPLQCRNGGGAEGGLPLCGNGERRDAVPRRDRRVERRVQRGGGGADGRGARHGRAAARQRG